ncbi:MAG: hypothetical protein AAFX80_17600 [Cyanobacteria bacterium J06639_18]
MREIQAGLERSKRRREFEIISKWAVRADDLLFGQPCPTHKSGQC